MNALFIMNENDKKEVVQWLRTHRNLSDQQVARVRARWFTRRVRRRIPEARVLAQRFAGVYEVYKHAKTGKGEFLFRQQGEHKMEDIYNSLMDLILNGYCSDPEGEEMYYQIERSKTGMPTYKCVRGSSGLEGWHLTLRNLVTGYNVGPELADARILTGLTVWNQRAAVKNMGATDFGHYQLEIIDRVQEAERNLFGAVSFPDWVVTPKVSPEKLPAFGTARPMMEDLCLQLGRDESHVDAGALGDDADDADDDAMAALVQLQTGVQRADAALAAGSDAQADADVDDPEAAGAATDDTGHDGAPAPDAAQPGAAAGDISHSGGGHRATISTRRQTSAAYVRAAQGLSHDVRPIEATDAALNLFFDILPQILPRDGDRRKTIDYHNATRLYNNRVKTLPPGSGYSFVCISWMEHFCKRLTARYATQQAVRPLLGNLKALWRQLAASAAEQQWEPGAGILTLHRDDDAAGQRGATLPTMPLGAGPPSDAVHPIHNASAAATDDDIIDAAYNAVCSAHPEILTAANLPTSAVTTDLKNWLTANRHSRLVGRINKDNVKARLRRRRDKKLLVLTR